MVIQLNSQKYKTVHEDFITDVEYGPFTTVFNGLPDEEDRYWAFLKMYSDLINEHAPIKQKKQHVYEAPFVHADLKSNSEQNKCTDLRRRPIKDYFVGKCNDGPNNFDFWFTIKPFLSTKGTQKSDVLLEENIKIVYDKKLVANIFIKFYVNVGNNNTNPSLQHDCFTQDMQYKYINHSSIKHISARLQGRYPFLFQKVDRVVIKKKHKEVKPKMNRLRRDTPEAC